MRLFFVVARGSKGNNLIVYSGAFARQHMNKSDVHAKNGKIFDYYL